MLLSILDIKRKRNRRREKMSTFLGAINTKVAATQHFSLLDFRTRWETGQPVSKSYNPGPGESKSRIGEIGLICYLKLKRDFLYHQGVVKGRVNRSTMGSFLSSFYGGPAEASTGEDNSSSEPSRVMTFDSSESWKIYFKRAKESNKLVSSLFNNY